MSDLQMALQKAFNDAILYGNGFLTVKNTSRGYEINHIDWEKVVIKGEEKPEIHLPRTPWHVPDFLQGVEGE